MIVRNLNHFLNIKKWYHRFKKGGKSKLHEGRGGRSILRHQWSEVIKNHKPREYLEVSKEDGEDAFSPREL